jgi:hypothetical protein
MIEYEYFKEIIYIYHTFLLKIKRINSLILILFIYYKEILNEFNLQKYENLFQKT